jgi:hypothetical protein
MIEQPVPTRAEVSDVATAVFEGADAVMLSAESATGAWPDKAVMTMHRIAQAVEQDPLYRGVIDAQRTEPEPTTPTPSPTRRAISPRRCRWRRSCATPGPVRPDCAPRVSARQCRLWRSRRRPKRAAAWRSSGGCTACSPRTPRTSTTWCSGPAALRLHEGFAKVGRAHRHHRRRAAGDSRQDQHAAHRASATIRESYDGDPVCGRNGAVARSDILLDLRCPARPRARVP